MKVARLVIKKKVLIVTSRVNFRFSLRVSNRYGRRSWVLRYKLIQ